MRSWIGGHIRKISASVNDLPDESNALKEALQASSIIMDDELDKAKEELEKSDSTFHKLGVGVVLFMKAVMGLESDLMNEAVDYLAKVEKSATDAYELHRYSSKTDSNRVYSLGTEYLLIQSQVQLMIAVLAILNESSGITGKIGSFMKLNSSYSNLEKILKQEKAFVCSNSSKQSSEGQQEQEEFVEIDKESLEQPISLPTEDDIDISMFPHIIDTFILASSNMCFGVLQLLLSFIPPTLAKAANWIGFKTDREQAVSLLWKATKVENINSAFAGLAIIGFWNQGRTFNDITPPGGNKSFPKEKCIKLLTEFRQKFPKSGVWLIEEGRDKSMNRNIEGSLDLLYRQNSIKNPIKQIEAYHCWEVVINLTIIQQYEESAKLVMDKLLHLNKWSPALYYYIAASCYLELYRQTISSDLEKAKSYANQAEEYYEKIPENIGKRKFLSKPLPFDVMVERRLARWKKRAETNKSSFSEAIGISPLTELLYVWGFLKRLGPNEFQKTLDVLEWSKSENSTILWENLEEDEKVMHETITASVIRDMGDCEKGKQLLQEVIAKPRSIYKGELAINWPHALAYYEMAVSIWFDYLKSKDAKLVDEVQVWLDKVVNYGESYEVDNRVGLRIKSGLSTISKEKEHIASIKTKS